MLNMVRLPLIFISGVFIPIDSIPSIGKIAVYFSPLTYGNDLIQSAYEGSAHFNPLIDVAMLCVFILIFQVLANRLYKKFNA
jgi:ABC-2 type transport system permease protein